MNNRYFENALAKDKQVLDVLDRKLVINRGVKNFRRSINLYYGATCQNDTNNAQ
jgi:hypothetical protein